MLIKKLLVNSVSIDAAVDEFLSLSEEERKDSLKQMSVECYKRDVGEYRIADIDAAIELSGLSKKADVCIHVQMNSLNWAISNLAIARGENQANAFRLMCGFLKYALQEL